MQRHTIHRDDVAIHVLDTGGDGIPVVFLHGVMGRGIHWQGTMAALAPRYRGIALDQRGHGRSDRPAGPYDRDAYVDDLACVVDALGLERFAIVGHSTGALNAWVYAARHPARVTALVLEDMTAARKGDDFLAGWRAWLASWPLPFTSHADLVRHFAAIRPSLGGYFAETFAEAADGWRPIFSTDAVLATLAGNEAKDWWDELAAVRCPALVVRGERSDWLGDDESRRIAATIPRGRLAVVEDAGHTVHVDQPEVYRELVADFLDAAIAGTTPAPRPYSDAQLAARARAQYTRGDAGFALGRAALIMIDMQDEFVEPVGGPYRVPAAAARIPDMARLLAAFRARGLPVIHTAFAETHEYLDRPRLGAQMPNRVRDAGAPGLFRTPRFAAALAPLPGEPVILKPSYGAFFDTPLETILKRLDVDTVVLAGALTDCCVGTTARQAYERGFGAVVASDATATTVPEMHDAELKILRRAFARVLDVDLILRELPVASARTAASLEAAS